MKLSHVNVGMPEGGEESARAFYGGLLGLQEVPKPEPLRVRGGVWFSAGGVEIHLSVETRAAGPDTSRHFGLECVDVEELRRHVEASGVQTENGRAAPWKRFFVRDPFGNRIEIHDKAAGIGSAAADHPASKR